MGLDSAVYLLFLGIVALLNAALPPKGRVVLLLCASLAFYAAANCAALVLLLVLCVFNFAATAHLSRPEEQTSRTAVFGAIVTLNVGVLILFKYALHLTAALMSRAGWVPAESALARIGIPLGISYFIFQMLACATDAYRGDWKLEGGLGRFVLFGFFFPQISSGPIPRADRLLPQFGAARPSGDDVLTGLRLIAFGLFKKYAVAGRLADYVTQVFEGNLTLTTLPTLVGCCCNALQLYADFSGYTDIAIGSARLLGIRLDPNFNHPFASTSMTELWRRWHMTLSFWLRDYVYMPLVFRIRNLGRLRVAVALIVTFALCGVWHAATWTFLIFGVSQGAAMSVEALTRNWRADHLSKILSGRAMAFCGWLYTMGFFVLSTVLFHSATLSQAGHVYARLLDLKLPHNVQELTFYSGTVYLAFAIAAIASWAALARWLARANDGVTPQFLFACAVLTLFLGRLGAHFIYAGF